MLPADAVDVFADIAALLMLPPRFTLFAAFHAAISLDCCFRHFSPLPFAILLFFHASPILLRR